MVLSPKHTHLPRGQLHTTWYEAPPQVSCNVAEHCPLAPVPPTPVSTQPGGEASTGVIPQAQEVPAEIRQLPNALDAGSVLLPTSADMKQSSGVPPPLTHRRAWTTISLHAQSWAHKESWSGQPFAKHPQHASDDWAPNDRTSGPHDPLEL